MTTFSRPAVTSSACQYAPDILDAYLLALASFLRLGTTRQQSSSLTQFAWPRIILAPPAFSNEAKSYVDLRSLYLATTGRTSSSSSVGSASNDSSRRKRVKASS